jgi:hypothetical protein
MVDITVYIAERVPTNSSFLQMNSKSEPESQLHHNLNKTRKYDQLHALHFDGGL